MVIQMDQNNLDYICAKYGQDIPQDKSKDLETTIQKSLGVLQEDGLFAFVLYLESKNSAVNKRIKNKTAKLLYEVGLTDDSNDRNMRKKILEITKSIDDMFLAKDIIEKTLVYARYRAKALKNE